MQKQLLIAAGGQGTRLSSDALPKQFATAAGRPLLLHSMDAFIAHDPEIRIVIVLPPGTRGLWLEICGKYGVDSTHIVAEGGPTRFHSVKSGLKHIDSDGLVAIHDGVRPLVSESLVRTVFDIAHKFGNAVPAILPRDSVRQADHAINKPMPRDRVRLIQTPQCFHAAHIKEAYRVSYDASFTDDACVLESQGERIYLVDGEADNFKVTTGNDLVIAGILLRGKRGA